MSRAFNKKSRSFFYIARSPLHLNREALSQRYIQKVVLDRKQKPKSELGIFNRAGLSDLMMRKEVTRG